MCRRLRGDSTVPLKKGKSKKVVGENIHELQKALMKHGGKGGKPQSKKVAHKRAVAAAMRMAGMGLKEPQ